MTATSSDSQQTRGHATSVAVDPAALLLAAEDILARLAELQADLLDVDTKFAQPELDALGVTLERIRRSQAVCQAQYAGLHRGNRRGTKRSRSTDASHIADTTGCSRPEAFGHIDAANDLDDPLLGPALRSHQLTTSQAAGIRAAMEAFTTDIPDEVIATEARSVIAGAGHDTRSRLRDELMQRLSRHLPASEDAPRRRSHQRRARSAKLGEQRIDGMSRLQLELPADYRPVFEACGAQASAMRAKLAEDANTLASGANREEAPEVPTYEQAYFDVIVGAFLRGALQSFEGSETFTARSTAAEQSNHLSQPDSSAQAPLWTDEVSAQGQAASTGALPSGSVIVKIDPRDLNNRDKLVSTNTGSWMTVADALEMASRGSTFISAYFGGKAHLFRVEEVDPDSGARNLRFATALQRLVLFALYDGCVWPGCTEPATRTQVHHLIPWSAGGLTELDNLAPVCRPHHNMIHDGVGGYQFGFAGGSGSDPPIPEWIPNSSLDDDTSPPPF